MLPLGFGENLADGGASCARAAWVGRLSAELTRRRAENLYRELRVVEGRQGPTLKIQGREYIQFCTNNYLGLADDPEVVDAARVALDRYGMGAGASRLVAGSMEMHHKLEVELARFKGVEAALVFSTGYMANQAALITFAGPGDRIISDKLNHASLLDAAKFSGAGCRTFAHRNYRRAVELMKRGSEGEMRNAKCEMRKGGATFLVTDSVFSMDGDVADLPRLCEVAEGNGGLVIIDEAHGTGVLGEHGRGLAELQGVEGRIALTVGTLSKAFGSVGGYIGGSREVVETLVNGGRSFIYTTALPPVCSGASLAALGIIEREPGRRERVMGLARRVKGELEGMGFECGDSETPIVPVMIGDAGAAMEAAEFLRGRGLFVPAIRPPTVPPNGARLRLSLMATHTDGHIDALLGGMRELRGRLKDRA